MLYGAGPPCQPVSAAGSKKGDVAWNLKFLLPHSKADPRAKCYRACEDYIRMRKPLSLTLEQVPGVLKNKKLRKTIYQRWINLPLGDSRFYPRLASVKEKDGSKYYEVHAAILSSDDFGLPQSRRRLFIVALRRNMIQKPWQWPIPFKKKVKLETVLDMTVRGEKRGRILEYKRFKISKA